MSSKAQEILDGTLLGDGNLTLYPGGINAGYVISASKPLVAKADVTDEIRRLSLMEHLKYMKHIYDNSLRVFGVDLVVGCPKIRSSVSHGKAYDYAHMSTHVHPSLTDAYNEWYKDKVKVLPDRIMNLDVLPRRTLTHFFVEDGGSSWFYDQYKKRNPMITFSTHGFSKEEVYHINSMINNAGIYTKKPYKTQDQKVGSGLIIQLTRDSVNRFMDVVEPCLVDIFGVSSLTTSHLVKRYPVDYIYRKIKH